MSGSGASAEKKLQQQEKKNTRHVSEVKRWIRRNQEPMPDCSIQTSLSGPFRPVRRANLIGPLTKTLATERWLRVSQAGDARRCCGVRI